MKSKGQQLLINTPQALFKAGEIILKIHISAIQDNFRDLIASSLSLMAMEAPTALNSAKRT